MKLIVLLVFAAGSYLMIRSLFARNWEKGLSLRMSFSQENVPEGEEVLLEEVLENRKRLPMPGVKVKFQVSRLLRFEEDADNVRAYACTDRYYRNDMFSLPPYGRITRRLPFVPTRRGCYSIDGIQLVASDLFLVQTYAKACEEPLQLLVAPKRYRMEAADLPFTKMMGELLVKGNASQEAMTFRGLREYQTTDPLKQVNWKASAKLGEWYVNQYEPELQREVTLVMDLTKNRMRDSDELQEEVLRVAGSIAQAFLSYGMRVAFYANVGAPDSEGIRLSAGSGYEQSLAIDEALARVDFEQGPKPYEQFFEAFGNTPGYVVYVSASAHAPLQSAVRKRREEGRECQWVLVQEEEGKDEMSGLCHLWRRGTSHGE